MATETQQMVREFMRKMGLPTYDREARPRLHPDSAALGARLIVEEAVETLVGLVGSWGAVQLLKEWTVKVHELGDVPPDLVEAVDGLCDLIYVAHGRAETMNVDLELPFLWVHEANMAKEAVAIDAHGKRGFKPPGWVDPKAKIRKHLVQSGYTP